MHFQVRKYFSLADKDGDGQITKDEWFKVLNTAGVPTTMCVDILCLVLQVLFYSGERLMDFSRSWTRIWMGNFHFLSFLGRNLTLRGYSGLWIKTMMGLSQRR